MIKPSAVQWNKYHVFRDRDEEVVVFPIKSNGSTALTILNQDGRVKKTKNHVTSKLIVSKNSKGELTAVVGTFIYDQNYARDFKAELDTLGYLFEGSHYSGYFLTSRLDGLMLLGRNLKRGKANFAFRWSSNNTTTRDTDQIHLYISLNEQGYMTRSAQVEQETDGAFKCSFCNKSADECHCAEVTACGNCHKQLSPGEICSCNNKCSTCGFSQKECNCCKKCGNNKSQCTCNRPSEGFNNPGANNGNSDGGPNNGSYDNGNSGGHGPNPGNSYPSYGGSSGNGGGYNSGADQQKDQTRRPPTSKSYHITKEHAEDVSKYVYTHIEGSNAMCNVGVRNYAEAVIPNYPFTELKGLANQIYDNLLIHDNWYHIKDKNIAQDYANKGFLVIAAWKNNTRDKYGNPGHGHVVIILPKDSTDHNSWPRTMDTGYKRRGNNYYLNQSFGYDKIDNVIFFIFKL